MIKQHINRTRAMGCSEATCHELRDRENACLLAVHARKDARDAVVQVFPGVVRPHQQVEQP